MLVNHEPSDIEMRVWRGNTWGDRVIFAWKTAEIELAACDPKDPEADWYLKEYGGGVMIVEPTVFGRAFISAAQLGECEYRDLFHERVASQS